VNPRLSYLIILLFLLIGCRGEDDGEWNGTPGVLTAFVSLTAEQDTVRAGGSTKVTAVAEGELIRYIWSATQGDILGSGSQVTWVAPSCACGNGDITCKARAGGRELSKTITIVVVDE
jgi:hypothetical protein